MERKARGLKADLDAANREVRQVMDENAALKKDQHREAQKNEAKYAVRLATMAVLAVHLAEMVAELARRIADQPQQER